MRNQSKFEESELHLNFEKQQVEDTTKKLLEKLENLRINLSVKFFKNIQIKYYENLDTVFDKMKNVKNELNQLETNEANKDVYSQEASYM